MKLMKVRYSAIEDPNNPGAWGVWDNKEKTIVRDEKDCPAHARLMAAKLNFKEDKKKSKLNLKDLDYTILRPTWFTNANEVDYEMKNKITIESFFVVMSVAKTKDSAGKIRYLAVEGPKKELEAVAAQCGVNITGKILKRKLNIQ